MRFRMLRGFSILAMLVGALGVGVTAHAAAPSVSMAKLCSNGAYVLYMDDNGDQFANEAACVAWTRQHPGQPPIAIDDDPDGHADQPVNVDTDGSNDQSGSTPATTTDDSDDQSGDTSTAATDDSNDQSTGKVALVIVTDPTDAGTATTDDSSDDGDG